MTPRGIVIYRKDGFSDSIDPAMAIEFKDMSSHETEMLSAYVTHALAGDLVRERDEDVLSDKS